MVEPLTLIYSSVFMSFIKTRFNFSPSCTITLSSFNFRRMENIILSGLLAFVQATLLIKTVQLCSKLICAAEGWGGGETDFNRNEERRRKRERKKNRMKQSELSWMAQLTVTKNID